MSFSTLPINFLGLNEGDDPKNLPPGTLLVAENCAMDKSRRLVKRFGTDGLVKSKIGGGSISAGKRLFQAGDGATGLLDSTSAYVYDNQLALWKEIDRCPNLYVTKRQLTDGVKSVVCADVGIYQNLLVSAWNAGENYAAAPDSPVFAQVQNVTTWGTVVPPTTLTGTLTGSYPRVVTNGSKVIVFWSTSAGSIKYREFDGTTGALGASGTLVTGLVASSIFDVHVEGGEFYVAYSLAAGANRVTVRKYSAAYASVLGPTSVGGAVLASSICIHATAGESVKLAYAVTGVDTYIATFNIGTLATTSGPTGLAVGFSQHVAVTRFSATEGLLVYGQLTAGVQPKLVSFTYTAATTAVSATTQRTTYGVWVPSKIWTVNGRFYCSALTLVYSYVAANAVPVNNPSRIVIEILTSSNAFLRKEPTHRHVATLETQTSWLPRGADYDYLPSFAQDSSGTVYTVAPLRDNSVVLLNRAVPLSASIATVKTVAEDSWRQAVPANVTSLAGGALVLNDGATTQPYGFIHSPIIAETVVTGGAGVIGAGTYSWVTTFSWRDAAGILHRSEPSAPVTLTLAANDRVDLTISTAGICGKLTEGTDYDDNAASQVLIDVYRTTANGSVLYKLTRDPLIKVVNDTSLGDVTFTDVRNDTNIIGAAPPETLSSQPQLYTNFEVADIAPPAFITTVSHRNRIFGIAADQFTVWASKDAGEDIYLAPGFNEALTLTFQRRKVALASMDEKLVAFDEDGIDVVVGDGPDSAGNQNTWQIVGLQKAYGCINPRSVVTTPLGVMYQSRRGLEVLGRDLAVPDVALGINVEDTLTAFPSITSAVVVPSMSEVRWTCNNTAGTSGVVIVFDYHNKQWFTRKYKDAADTDNTSTPFVDAMLINDVYTMLTAGGQVYREDTTTRLDDGTDFVARDVQLAWISPGGPNGWSRFKVFQVLGTSVSNHDLKVSVARDFATTWEQDNTFAAQTDATTIGPLQKCRILIQNQKAQAIRVRLQDLTPSSGSVGTGEGPIWEGLALQYLQKRGTALNSASREA